MNNYKSDNMLHSGKASASAFRVANHRAVHQLLDEPIILEDPLALKILGAKAQAELGEDPFKYNDFWGRGRRACIVARSKFAEDELAHAVAACVRQYVILGAGLDTFPYRNPHGDALKIYEVDHPATQSWKQQLLADAGIPVPGNLTFVPVDFETGTLAMGLRDAGFRMDQPVCFSWLGVAMYLTEAAVMDTLRFVTSLPKGTSIAFDFLVPASMLGPIERAAFTFVDQYATAHGEPWISFAEPETLRAQALALGFSEAETFDGEAINRRYFHRRKDGLRANVWLFRGRV